MIYKIIVEKSPRDLAKEVNLHLDLGWELYGTPFVDSPDVCQALVYKLKSGKRPKEIER